MDGATEDVPKAFLTINQQTLFERQLEVISEHVDAVTVVLGYNYENVIDQVDPHRAIVFEDWREYENAASLRLALETIDDDVLVMNGDIVVTQSVIDRLVDRFESFDGEHNVVGCLPGTETEHTAVQCDDDGFVVDYGMIPGHRHTGLGIISADHVPEATAILRANATEWYPIIYPRLSTKCLRVPPNCHIEINRPDDLETAKEHLPAKALSEVNALI